MVCLDYNSGYLRSDFPKDATNRDIMQVRLGRIKESFSRLLLFLKIFSIYRNYLFQLAFSPQRDKKIYINMSTEFFKDIGLDKDCNNLIDRLTLRAARLPNKIAIDGKRMSLTCAGLLEQLNQIALLLKQYDPSNDRPVALLLDHSENLITAILGVHFSGKCYAPIDVSFPSDRLKIVLRNMTPSVLLTEKKYHAEAISSVTANTTVLLVDELIESSKNIDIDTNAFQLLTPDDNAYLLSTSGTTGEPKGIAHNQRSMMRSVKHYIGDLDVCSIDNIGLILPCTYTPSVFSIFGAIESGATLCPFDLKNQSFKNIIKWIKEKHITLLYSSPTLFRALMKACQDPIELSSIRSIQLAGEPLFRSDILAYQARFSDVFDLYNGMGSSETSCLTRFFINSNTVIRDERVPIGIPYDDVKFYICDENGKQVPDGNEGDLIAEGAYFANGYWQRPDLTKEKFFNTNTPNVRRYATGDRALRRHDGNYVHLGRSDDQIKLRGQRVELAAIESTILHSGLALNAAAVLIEPEATEPFIAAFFSPSTDIAALREYLSSQLPPFMIPTRIVSMQSLPLNTSGKIDRKSLKTFDFSDQTNDVEQQTSAPLNVIQNRILECFKRILSRDDLHNKSDFFQAGGDSINGVELAIELEKVLSISINVSALIEAPTPEKMSQLVTQSLYVNKSKTLVKFETSYKDLQNRDALPLFCLPGLPGNALAFRALAEQMCRTRDVYGFVYLGQDGSGANFSTIEDFVDTCVAEIDRVYPTGPVAIAGYSIGGTIGYELIKKLKANGREIALFALIDAYAPNDIKRAHICRSVMSKIKHMFKRAGYIKEQQREVSDLAITRAVYRQKVRPQNINNTLLIVAKDNPKPFRFGFFDKYLQWQKLIKSGIHTVETNGSHVDMLKKHKAAEVTSVLNAFLSDQDISQDNKGSFSMETLSDIWRFRNASSLVFKEIDEDELHGPIKALLTQPKQLTNRLQEHLKDELQTKLVTSTQKGCFYSRKVSIHTKSTNKTAVIAAIQIAMNRFNRSFVTEVLQTSIPFGTILKNHAIDYSCEVVSLFKIAPDLALSEEFGSVQLNKPLYGRCNRFTNSKGQVLANVVEVIADWV